MKQRDRNKIIVDYFKKNLNKNYTQDSLKFALLKQGYSRTAIDAALEEANKELAATAPIIKEKPTMSYETISQEVQPVSSSTGEFGFNPNLYNILIPLVITITFYLIGRLGKIPFLLKPFSLLSLLVLTYVIVSLLKE